MLTQLALLTLALPPTTAQVGADGAVIAPQTTAASPSEVAHARVGLVLSSGITHALTQVGALAALEELHVPVDFVSGSEGGALVGGLYASGVSVAEVREMLQSRRWVNALEGTIVRPLLSWRQRTVDRDFLFDVPIAIGPDEFGLAPGLKGTRWLSWLLASTTLPVSGARTFDDLPIPFRAGATDLLSGEAVILGSGNLADAIVASLATPGLYASVRIDGRQLGSGALKDPFPIGAALDAGCDVIVVIDCAPAVDRAERLRSFLTATTQLQLLAGAAERRAALSRLRPTDFLIAPDLESKGDARDRSAVRLFKLGRDAVLAHAGELDRIRLDDVSWVRYLAARSARRPALPVLGEVRLEFNAGPDASVRRARIESQAGERLEQDVVQFDLLRLYGLDYDECIDMALDPREGDVADLVLRSHETDASVWNPRVGAALEGVFGEDATYVMGAAATIRPFGKLGAEWRNRIEVGSRVLLYSEFWQPIDPSARWFIAPAVEYQKERVNVTDGDDVVATFDLEEVGGRVDVGRVLGEWGEARVGLVKQSGRTDLAVGDPAQFEGDTFDEGFFEGSVTVDTVDSLGLPREGTIGRVVVSTPVEWLGGDDNSSLQAQIDHAHTWERTTLVLGGEFSTSLDNQDAVQNAFPLGGFLRLSGLGRDTITGAHAGLARAVTWIELGPQGLDRGLFAWNLGASLEAGQTWNDRDDISVSSLRTSGSMFVALETLFGPVFLGVGLTEPDQTAVFVVFGNLFGSWDPF